MDLCLLPSGSPLLHDFNLALRGSITHIVSFFVYPLPLVIYCVIHCWWKHVWVSLLNNTFSLSAIFFLTMEKKVFKKSHKTAYLANILIPKVSYSQWQDHWSLFITQNKAAKKHGRCKTLNSHLIIDSLISFKKKTQNFLLCSLGRNGWASEKAAAVNTNSSFSDWKYSIHCPKGNAGWAEEKFWLVIKCQRNNAKGCWRLM